MLIRSQRGLTELTLVGETEESLGFPGVPKGQRELTELSPDTAGLTSYPTVATKKIPENGLRANDQAA